MELLPLSHSLQARLCGSRTPVQDDREDGQALFLMVQHSDRMPLASDIPTPGIWRDNFGIGPRCSEGHDSGGTDPGQLSVHCFRQITHSFTYSATRSRKATESVRQRVR